MKTALSVLLALIASCFLATGTKADGDEEVTLKGKLLCAKCQLHETPKCMNVMQVKKDGKTINYYMKDKGSKEPYHKGICGGGAKKATMTGYVSKKDGKNWLVPTNVDVKK
jgi:hypothetical protein